MSSSSLKDDGKADVSDGAEDKSEGKEVADGSTNAKLSSDGSKKEDGTG